MKKITISALLITTMLSAWEINTHRAIDQKAIEKSDNLKSFIKNSQIDNKTYENEKFEGYGDYTYFTYITDGEKNGITQWNQSFSKYNYQDLIEAGTILEDAQWPHLIDGGKYNYYDIGDGRFNNHFADPQNNYKGFSLGEANALSWATGVARHYPGVNPYLQDSNQYDYLNALEYFKDGFVSKQLDERRRYQAKMLVSVEYRGQVMLMPLSYTLCYTFIIKRGV